METPDKATEWVPSPKQASVLKAAQESGLKRSITGVCRRAEVDPKTFYRWMKGDPGFRAAWADLWKSMADLHFPTAVSATIHKARAGDIPAVRLLAEMKGVLTKRVELTGKNGGPVRTIDMTKLTVEQLDALIALDPEILDHVDTAPTAALEPVPPTDDQPH
jgi:hypothetical protein